MVERSRRGKRSKRLMGNHQRCWIWGRHVVLETLNAGKWPILELHVSDRLPDAEQLAVHELADRQKTTVTMSGPDALRRLCGSAAHQGYLAKMPPFPYDDASELLNDRRTAPLYLILDSLQDPYNFGAILRSADAFGIDAVFVDTAGQAEVNSLVARSSAGAVNHIRLGRTRLVPLCDRLSERQISIVAASQSATTSLAEYDFCRPTALIIGNEGAGIRTELLERCEALVAIPQQGTVDSLNAAVSAGVVLYEASRQRLRRDSR